MKKLTKKKLTLNKETVAHLAVGDLQDVVGAFTAGTCDISMCFCTDYYCPQTN